MHTLSYRNDNPSPAATEEGFFVCYLTYTTIYYAIGL